MVGEKRRCGPVEFRTLKYFLTVAREENITRAAALLHLTQPTLSRQLMQLEEELGVKLFRRSQHHIVLTEAGMLLRRRAQEIVELAEMTARELRPAEEVTGRISIGSGDLRIVGDGVGRAFFERFGDETVAVEGIAPQGEEDGVRLDPARVGRDTGVLAEKFV